MAGRKEKKEGRKKISLSDFLKKRRRSHSHFQAGGVPTVPDRCWHHSLETALKKI
ncbi:MAG: hypothetical protein HQL94_08815 [Magnetococcales bacterium]|nr:hypothetical protein [Magnetococcales bacterium]